MADWRNGAGAVVLVVHYDSRIAEQWLQALSDQRPDWTFKVAIGAHQAARALSALASIDAIITAAHLDDGDAPSILSLAERRHPKGTRIVIGGAAPSDNTQRSLQVSHRFFLQLKALEACETIEGNHELQRRLADPSLLAIVHSTDILPSPPESILKLNELMMNPEASLSEVAAVIEADPAMTAKLLQLVNSAYFGLSHRVTNGRQAVALLGFSTVRNLLMAVELMRSFTAPRGDLIGAVDSLQEHSLAVGNLARTIMGDRHESIDAFAAGMLHDIGMLAVIATLPDRFITLRDEVVRGGRPLEESESLVLGTSHANIGAYLLDQWGLPMPLVEAVARSHDAADLPGAHLGPVHAVYVAEQLLATMKSDASTFWEQGEELDEDYLVSLGIYDVVTEILSGSKVN